MGVDPRTRASTLEDDPMMIVLQGGSISLDIAGVPEYDDCAEIRSCCVQ